MIDANSVNFGSYLVELTSQFLDLTSMPKFRMPSRIQMRNMVIAACAVITKQPNLLNIGKLLNIFGCRRCTLSRFSTCEGRDSHSSPLMHG